MASIYSLDGRVPLIQAVPFGLQHVLAMFVANITPIIILANVAGIDPEISAALIQNCMIIAGIGTLVQLYPIWRFALAYRDGHQFHFPFARHCNCHFAWHGHAYGRRYRGRIGGRMLGTFP